MNVVEFVLCQLMSSRARNDQGSRSFDVPLSNSREMINGPVALVWWLEDEARACARDSYEGGHFVLDEPTNHLDVKNVAWLEEYLNSQTQVSSMIVSHDSGFLDACARTSFTTKPQVGDVQRVTHRIRQAVPGGEEVHRAFQRRTQVHLPGSGFPRRREEQGQGHRQGDQVLVQVPEHDASNHPRRDRFSSL